MTSHGPHRNVVILAICQALYMTSIAATSIAVALVGNTLAEDKSLTTLPVSLQFLAAMATALPASFFMRRIGRQRGFITGAGIGCTGALICTYAIFEGSFALFCVGSAVLGSFSGFAQYFRFAAAEAAALEFRAKAISLVMAGGVVAAVLGPGLARLANDLFAPVLYAGIYLSIVALFVLIIALMTFARLPRLSAAERRESGRPLKEIARQPTFLVAVVAATAAYATMMLLMTVAPLAMAECNFTFTHATWMMLGHMLGMFAPSFFTGHLIKRFGVLNVMLVGAVLLAVTLATDLAGVSLMNFYLGMTLLGVGWNFLFIGGTTLITQTHTPSEAAKVQGLNDFLIWTSVTVAVLASGALQVGLGWTFVNIGVVPVIAAALLLTLWLKLRGQTLAVAA